MSDEYIQKGVLSSIRNMFSRKSAQGATGPAVTATAPHVKPPAAPAPAQLSGRAEDHTEHVTHIARMMQQRGGAGAGPGPVRDALHNLSEGHQHMQRARQAYEAGDHDKARKILAGAQAYMKHAETTHASTAAIHGESLSHRIGEMHRALGSEGTVAKAEQAQDYTGMVAAYYRSR